jgi:tetratricopeptide (TPR) repeat protein
MAMPDPERLPDVEMLTEYESIQLFLQRARALKPDFGLTESNADVIARICVKLDGLPLAIELAAARVRVLPPAQIVPKLADRLSFLTDGLVDAPDRHQTMRAAIGWSYDLLDPAEQQLLRRLSIFVGGWTLEAAEAMVPAGIDPIDGLALLANDNLIRQTNSSDSEVRFTMLETVREFGLQQLDALDEREQASQAHAGHFLHFVERAEPELRGPNQADWLRRLADDMSNIRSTLVWSERSDVDPDIGLRLASAMVWFWECRGPVSEGRDRIARALARESGTPEIRMKALVANGWLAHIQRDSDTARRLLDEAMLIAEQVDDRWTIAWILHLLGRVAYFDGDADRARELAERCLTASREVGDEWLAGWAYHLMALAAHIGGDLSRAHEHYSASLKIRNEVGYPEGIATVTGLLGMLALREGDHVTALNHFRKSLEINGELGARWLVVNMLANIVLISVTAGDSRRAAMLAGFVDAVSDDLGADPIPIAEATFREGVHAARMALGDEGYDELSASGRKMTMNDAIVLALELPEPFADPEPAVESG